MRFELSFNSMVLTGTDAIGRRTFYARVTVCSRSIWVQWWDTGRCIGAGPRILVRSRDGLMCLTAGSRK